ncbi:MAG TPA: sensor histidine kinase [Candidatus Binatia bacterium]|nr:sensor histidine kinase [Candidatus Binatia bacterium]
MLVCGGLVASGLVELYFRYHESWEQLAVLQREITAAAAFKVERFVREIEANLRAAARNRALTEHGLTPDYRFELRRLLTVARPITEAVAVDAHGREQARASRFGAELPLDRGLNNGPAALARALAGRSYFGPVYFAWGSEPYMTVAVPIERFPGEVIGVLRAQVNLKYVWDVVAGLTIGSGGQAYAAARRGALVAHPEITLVLQQRDVAGLEQFKAAFNPDAPRRAPLVASSLDGTRVVTTSTLIPDLDWAVFVEQPLDAVYRPLYASLARTAILVLVGLAVALLAGLVVTRRVVRPLETLKEGVERIGRGDLAFRIELGTGDELEALADEVNGMAAGLEDARAGLERKVRERTAQLLAANEKLEELDRLKSEFVSNVSHELRTPLTAIQGAADNMRDGLTGALTEKQARYLMRIKSNTDRLARLIEDLLNLSRLEAGKLDLRRTQVSLAELAGEVTDSLRPVALEKRIALHVVCDDAPVTAWVDRDRVAQVLVNLIGNALKFTPVDGQVTISVRADGENARVSIADTGSGIPPDEADRIFERFYQGRGSAREKTSGTGLGLTICKALVERHGGTISLESRPGIGSTFSVTLPAGSQPGRAVLRALDQR